jgi:hypothetical protein
MMMTNALMEVLQFGEDDLATNRAGMLSAAQVERLRAARRRALLLSASALIVIALVASGLLFIAEQGGSWVGVLVGIALTLVNAVIMARAVQSWLRTEEDLRRGEVEKIEGSIARTVRVFGRLSLYLLTVNGHEVVVTKEVFNVVKDGGYYRLYRAQRTGTLLTAEAVR